jgi:hypothetical protein
MAKKLQKEKLGKSMLEKKKLEKKNKKKSLKIHLPPRRQLLSFFLLHANSIRAPFENNPVHRVRKREHATHWLACHVKLINEQ